MTDVQLLTIALAVIVPVSSLIYSNSRITDVKETLRAEIKTLQAELMGRFNTIDSLLHAMMGKLDELDRRLTTLEGRR
jgi:hypothetical protein